MEGSPDGQDEQEIAAVLETRGLHKSFGDGDTATSVLTDVDLEIAQGEFVALVGPSGSGKSTLLSILGLLDAPTSGEVLVNGENVARLSRRRLAALRGKTIGYVFQAFNLLAGLAVVENVMLPGLLAGKSGRAQYDRAIALLDQVDLASYAKRVPAELSGGQQQRVAVARALFMEPAVILADEPTGNLDTINGRKVIDALYRLNESGQTIVLVTHDRSIADEAPRLISLRDGRIEADTRDGRSQDDGRDDRIEVHGPADEAEAQRTVADADDSDDADDADDEDETESAEADEADVIDEAETQSAEADVADEAETQSAEADVADEAETQSAEADEVDEAEAEDEAEEEAEDEAEPQSTEI